MFLSVLQLLVSALVMLGSANAATPNVILSTTTVCTTQTVMWVFRVVSCTPTIISVTPIVTTTTTTPVVAATKATTTMLTTTTTTPSRTTTTTVPSATTTSTTTTSKVSSLTTTTSATSSTTSVVPSLSSSTSTTASTSTTSVVSSTTASTTKSESLSIGSLVSTTFAANLTSSLSSILAASSSTSSSVTTTTSGVASGNFSCASTSGGCSVDSTILIVARDSASAAGATSGLNAYGIPFQILLVPQGGAPLPALNSSSGGNFGGIIIASEVSYDYGSGVGYHTALSDDQWSQLYAYQIAYGVRMVQYEVYPGPLYGTTALGGCCEIGVEQLMSFTDTSDFAQAGLIQGATITTQGLYHYPASITDSSTTKQIAAFAANGNIGVSTAAVINNFNGRQQMVFFIGFSTDWSATSNLLQHAYITWMTRGVYAGFRRTYFATQIDDMMLPTDVYYPAGYAYRTSPDDMTGVANWVKTINGKMNQGSFYLPEIGYNGNGNILQSVSTTAGANACSPGAVDTGEHNDTALEFQKQPGTGKNAWPDTLTTYPYTAACLNYDPLKVWFDANKESFMHISHTFSHYELNNSTYSDALKEIQWNQGWFKQAGFTTAKYFSADGLIPPAITGLHNGDVLQAWTDAGLTHCVGDNTRAPLRNPVNPMWAATSNKQNNGFDGFTYVPRWATRIYYNCDTPICTTTEWIRTSNGISANSTFDDLLAVEKSDTMRHLFGLYHDGYMFHQANLRNTGVNAVTINGVSATLSIFQAWVEVIVQEFGRLVNWPMVTLKQGDLANTFRARQARDACNYKLAWQTSGSTITGVTVSATANTCSAPIPVTVPRDSVTDTKGFTTEQLGSDPLTIWVQLSGQPVTFTLKSPIKW